ncbi:MAG: MBL fold metallo-hydrolase [Gammaproteobacteria bacterium]|nr:MBL fold metallo-hydrolase [Gammaproteobacteria bacterium]
MSPGTVRTLRAISALLLLIPLATRASDSAPERHYELHAVTDRVHVLYGPLELPDEHNRGFRNNPVFVQTSAGLVVFDPGGSAAAGELVVRTARRISPDPIVALFNSHVHGDHWLGNEGVRRSYPRVPIYGHPRMKERLEDQDGPTWLETINRTTKGTADGRIVVGPDRTVDDGDVVRIGDVEFRIHHTGRAHTDNDIMIEIVGTGILFTGDVVRNGFLGLIEEDGGFQENIAAIDYLLSKDFDHYIIGHGTVGGKEVLQQYRAYLDTLYTTVARLYAKGLSDFEMKDEVRKALHAFRGWKDFELRLGSHISRAYLEVEAGAF